MVRKVMSLMQGLLQKKICVVGLGYVGLPVAVEFGKKFQVLGFDNNTDRIRQLREGYDRNLECSSNELLSASKLTYIDEIGDAEDCDIFIVTVPTPIDNTNRPDMRPLVLASQIIGSVLQPGSTVIYESTVYPGATEEICVPVLEQSSGLIYNKDFFCGYSPERINPGDKENTFTKIVKITSGSNTETSKFVDQLYSSVVEAGTFPVESMKVAEAAKVIENSQRDLNIAFVNELSKIFNLLKIDTLAVLEAAGSKWNFMPFKPGMVGGHCIGVDPYYLTHKAEQVGYNPEVILAGRRINDNMAKYAASLIVKKIIQTRMTTKDVILGILGITFKENCPDIRNSKIFDIIKEFSSWGIEMKICDPWADPDEVKALHGYDLVEMSDLHDLDAIVIAVGHNEFRSLSRKNFEDISSRDQTVILADLKSLFDRSSFDFSNFELFRL